MIKFTIALFCLLNFYSLAIATPVYSQLKSNEPCMDLLESLYKKTSLTQLPQKVNAGSEFVAVLSWDLEDLGILDDWDEIELTPLLTNRIPGSFNINSTMVVKEKGVFKSLSANILFQVSKNLVGLYEFDGVKFIARKSGTPICYTSKITPFKKSSLLVDNEVSNVDIFPPELSEFRFEPASAKPGEKVILKFKAYDKNSLCTDDGVARGRCEGNWHQSATSADGSQWLYFDSPLKKGNGDEYYFEFSIRTDARLGVYKLNQVFVRDVVGNFIVTPESSAQPILTVQ